jgi:hypothetical protein
LLQIINSNLTEREALSDLSLTGIVTWFHIISGFALIILGLVMLIWMLKQRGFRYYYAWLALDFRGVIEDIKMLMSFRLPDAHAGGMAALIRARCNGAVGCGIVWWVMVCVKCNVWTFICAGTKCSSFS